VRTDETPVSEKKLFSRTDQEGVAVFLFPQRQQVRESPPTKRWIISTNMRIEARDAMQIHREPKKFSLEFPRQSVCARVRRKKFFFQKIRVKLVKQSRRPRQIFGAGP
jgi:hypothetical protein